MATAVHVAIGIVVKRDRILIAQRHSLASLGNYWEFPGGKIEPGESPESCLVRELREELGIAVRISEPLAPIHFDYADKSIRLWPFLCELLQGEAQPLASQQIQWVRVYDLGNYRFPPANDSLLRDLAKRLDQSSEPANKHT